MNRREFWIDVVLPFSAIGALAAAEATTGITIPPDHHQAAATGKYVHAKPTVTPREELSGIIRDLQQQNPDAVSVAPELKHRPLYFVLGRASYIAFERSKKPLDVADEPPVKVANEMAIRRAPDVRRILIESVSLGEAGRLLGQSGEPVAYEVDGLPSSALTSTAEDTIITNP